MLTTLAQFTQFTYELCHCWKSWWPHTNEARCVFILHWQNASNWCDLPMCACL